jgi:arsenate reductase-like glutaredoxin family protein
MPPKRATFLSYGSEQQCVETKQFIEDAGVLLSIRDIEREPLTYDEIDRLIGYINPRHFLNMASPSFEKGGLDQQLPPRRELIGLILKDHTLLRRPIIQAARLTTVGCDKKSIALMLQLNGNGTGNNDDDRDRNHNVRNDSRRHDRRPRQASAQTR